MCRRAYGEIRLHRPLGDQLQLFCQHLPGQRTRVAGYDDTLTAEQVAAMMPTAAHEAGSSTGFYLGHTLSGSARPVRFNLREGSESDRNAAILSVGALGSGKTTLDQKLKYEGFLLGARRDRLRPQGRPPLPPARRGRAARRVHHAAPRPRPARGARPAARRTRPPAPGRRGVVPTRPAAGARRALVGDRGRGRRRSGAAPRARAHLPGGRARAARGRRDRPAGRQDARGLRPLGAHPARLRRPRREAAAGRPPSGHLPADPRPAEPRARGGALGVLAGRARRRADSCG